MAKKTVEPYDPNNKEPWHIAFEEEPVNDDFWSCIVTAAVPVEPSEEECIEIFNQMAQTDKRRAIKALTMADVMKILKSTEKKTKEKEKGKEIKKLLEPPPPRPSEIIAYAAKYAVFSDGECKLPPDLMAAVLKYLILNIKDEDIFKRKLSNARNKKLKEMEVKKEFINNYLKKEEKIDLEPTCEKYPKISNGNDEPIGGPEIYILLSGFYNPLYFLELNRLKVHFLALIRVESFRRLSFEKEEKIVPVEGKKKKYLAEFWQKIENELNSNRGTESYKDIAMLKYNAPNLETFESKEYAKSAIYDDISQIQYCTFFIYKHHQNFLQHLRVYPMVESLEPLDLDKCLVYNKLCDYFWPGDRGDEFLILYAMIEQVVAGVPETASRKMEYSLPPSDFFREDSKEIEEKKKCEGDKIILVPPCKKCRKKGCFKEQISSIKSVPSVPQEEVETIPENFLRPERSSKQDENYLSISFIDEIMSERGDETCPKTPKILTHDDYTSLRCLNFDPRIIDPSSVVQRFLFDSMIPRLWAKYPKLPDADRTYYDYQFYRLWEVSDENWESLRLKVHFTIVMNMVAFTASSVHKGDDENVSQKWEVSSSRLSRFSLPPFFSEDKFRRSSGDSMKGRISKTDFWKMFFKKIYDYPFSEEPKPKSIKIGLGLGREGKDDSIVKKVASTSNIFRPCVAPFSNSSPDWKNTANSGGKKLSGEEAFEEDVDQLWKILECTDIVSLEDPTFLTDFHIFEEFAKHFNDYEELKPNEMVQRLQAASDNYNMVQFNYFPPTDSIVLLMYNDCDYRGVYFDNDYGFLTTPLSLRDFYSFVFFEIKDWLKKEDKKYSDYVAERKERERIAEKKMKDEFLKKIKNEFSKMNEEEKEQFLGIKEPVKSKKEEGKKKEKESNEPTITEEDLEDLPKREKPKKPNVKSFDVINADEIRTQVNTKSIQFHSRDGSSVNIIILTWLYDRRRLLRLKIKKCDAELNYHYDINEPVEKDFHILTKSGIRICFFKKPEVEGFCFFMKATWPSGLVVETKLEDSFYIKQNYLSGLVADEESRCFVKEGKVLIFRKNGNVDILCHDMSKYGCYEFQKKAVEVEESKPKNQPKNCECKMKKEKKKKIENSKKDSFAKTLADTSSKENQNEPSQIFITDYDIITPRGEFYAKPSRPKCSQTKRLINTLKVLIGEDEFHEEIFYRREDGTNCTIWSDGKMVTTYQDGTKITTIPITEDEEINTEWTEEEKLHFLQLEAEKGLPKRTISQPREGSLRSILRNASQERSKSSVTSGFDPKDPKFFRVDGFVSVKCSYLIEHPKYSTVFYPSNEDFTEIKMPDVDIQIRKDGTYVIHLEKEAKIEVKENSVEFYTECFNCGKKSSSTIDFDSKTVLCKTTDYFDRTFSLYRNGETVVDCDENGGKRDEASFDFDLSEKELINGESTGERSLRLCNHDQPISSKQRLFVLERDLSGIEFLHDDIFTKYLEKGLHRTSSNIAEEKCRHFFEPLYQINYDNWTMNYQSEDSLPINLKRKDLKLLGQTENFNTYRYPFPKKCSQIETESSSVKIPPSADAKVILLRIIKTLDPRPVKILKQIVSIIKSYQTRSKEMYKNYKEHSVPDETPDDERYIKMRLKKIALTLNQSLKFFDHSGIITPSTDVDLHYSAHKHFLNQYLNQENVNQESNECYQEMDLLPKCKFINCRLSGIKRDSYISEIMENGD